MLKRIGAALVALGLFLPYSPDVRVIASVWHNAAEVLFQGFPVLLAFVYVLHTLVPAFARFDQRHGQRLHGALRMVYFVLVGAYLATATAGRADWPAVGPVLAAPAARCDSGHSSWGAGSAGGRGTPPEGLRATAPLPAARCAAAALWGRARERPTATTSYKDAAARRTARSRARARRSCPGT